MLSGVRHNQQSAVGILAELERAAATGDAVLYALAARLRAVRYCDECGAAIVELGVLADALTRRHQASDRVRALKHAVARSGIEVGDLLSPNFCSRHGQITPTSNM